MQDSKLNTLTLPVIVTGDSGAQGPAVIAVAPDNTFLRVMIRNVSLGSVAYFAHDGAVLSEPPFIAGNLYQLPSGLSDIFVLGPRQKLVGASNAAQCLICVAISVALPVDLTS